MREGIRLGDANVTIGFKALSMKDMCVGSFEGLGVQTELEYMYLQGNRLQNFMHLGCQPNLREVHLQGNRLSSFAGLVKQPKLELLNVQNNPISKHEYFRLMALLCCGPSLRNINGEKVGFAERDIVRRLPEAAAFAVSCGWLLDLKRRTYEEYLLLADEHRKTNNVRSAAPPPAPKQLPDVHSVLTSNILNLSHNNDIYSQSPQRVKTSDSGNAAGTGHFSPPPPSHSHSMESMSSSPVKLSNVWTPVGGYSSSKPEKNSSRRQPAERPSNVRLNRGGNMYHSGVSVNGDATSAAFQKLQRANHELKTQLEESLASKKRDKARVKSHLKNESDPMVSCILFEELDAVSELSFSKGIKVNSSASFVAKRTTSAPQSNVNSISSAFITIDTTHLCVSHFFNRIRVGEFAFSEIKELLLDATNNIIFLRTRDDTMVEITVECSQKLIVIYKTLHSRLGIIPELPKEIVQKETNIRKIKKKVKQQNSDGDSDSSSSKSKESRQSNRPFELGVASTTERKQQIVRQSETSDSDSNDEGISVEQVLQQEQKPPPPPPADPEISLLGKRKVSNADLPPKAVQLPKPVKPAGPPVDVLDSSPEAFSPAAAPPPPEPMRQQPPPIIEKEKDSVKSKDTTPTRKSSKSSSKSPATPDSDEEWQRRFEERQRKIILSENPTLY